MSRTVACVAWACLACNPYVVGERASPPSTCLGQLQPLGGSASGGGVTNRSVTTACARVALDPRGTPYVAWGDRSSGTNEVYLRRWDGQGWVGVGGSDADGGLSLGSGSGLDNGYRSCMGDVAFDDQGRAYATWANYDGTQQSIYVRRWNGSSWEELGASARGTGVATTAFNWWPRLSVRPAGAAVVWSRASEVYLSWWDGSAWRQLAGSATFPGVSGAGADAKLPVVVSGANDELFVAWEEMRPGGTTAVYLRRWNGSVWDELNGSATGPGLSSSTGSAAFVSIAHTDNGPVVSWEQTETDGGVDVLLRRWDGAGWASATGVTLREAGLSRAPRRPKLAVGAEQELYVAWEQDEPAGTSVQLARWTGSEWEHCGGSETLVATEVRSTWPVLAATGDGHLALSWFEETAPGVLQVFLAKGSVAPTGAAPSAGSYQAGAGCAVVPGSTLPLMAALFVSSNLKKGNRKRRGT